METPAQPVPYDLSAERWVLGSLLYDDSGMPAVDALLAPGDFYQGTHGQIYAAMQALYRAQPRQACTYGAVAMELSRRGQLAGVGGDAYLVDLWNNVPTGMHAAHFAGVVLDHALARALITAGGAIAGLGYARGVDAAARADQAERTLLAVTQRRQRAGAGQTLQGAMDSYLGDLAKRLDGTAPATPGWSTGLARLDDLIGGLRPGKLVVVVGESGGGKSTFGLAVTLAAAQAGARVGFYSLEMQEDELAERTLAHDAGVDSLLLRAGQLTSDEWQRVQAAYTARAAQPPVRLVTGGGFSYRDIAAQARAWAVDEGLHILAVDYLGLVRTAGRAGERVNELDSLINDLKALAMELHCTVLTFSQLSKAGAGANPEDWNRYLRGSGAIEHAADVILAVAPQGERPDEGTAPWPLQLAVTKHRGGPVGTVDALWWLAYSRIGEVTTRYA